MPRQIDDDAAADEIDRLGREASRAERVEGTSVDRDRLGQILSARAIFLLVVVRREPQGQAQNPAPQGNLKEGEQQKQRGGMNREPDLEKKKKNIQPTHQVD